MKNIGILIYPDAQQAAVYGLNDLFRVANRFVVERQGKDATTLGISHWQTDTLNCTPIRIDDSADDAPTPALAALILPPTLETPPLVPCTSGVAQWLRVQHQQGAILGSVCAGAFLLASTGLMTGRSMTTHWTYGDRLKQHFPTVQVDVNQLIIDDGDIISAGGVMSWSDLGLRLVSRLLGPTIMADTARMLLVDLPGREQRYYSVFSPQLQHGDTAILRVQHWLQTAGAHEMNLARLAAEAGLEARTFSRRFQKATGLTSTAYCQHLRVGRAQELLQFSTLPFERVAWEVGYSDPGALRKLFVRLVGLTPGDYRRRFSVMSASDA